MGTLPTTRESGSRSSSASVASDQSLDTTVAVNAERVRARIAAAARQGGRDPASVRLVAVTKKFPIDHVRAAVSAGLVHLGENRVQEALTKIPASAGLPITWHLIGHVQSNKARKAAEAFSWIHSVDSVALLRRFEQSAHDNRAAPANLSLLVQVDLAGEPTKHGADVSAVPDILVAATECVAVKVRGLMLIPPRHDDPEQVRPFFRRLRELRDTLIEDGVPPTMLGELSMGMSHDFEVAIEEGATIVRVGTALFGRRPQ